MRVIFASQRIEFTTGYRIDVAKWDAGKQRVKNGCTNKLKQSAAEINTDLLKYYAEIQNIFKEFEVQEVMPTTQQLKEAFNMRKVFDEFVKECGNQNNWTASTYEKFAAVRNHLKEFKEDATFNYFDEFGLNEYVNFLRDTKDNIHFENYMALPVISNQKMNDYLKELGELAEINEPVRETYYKGNERIDEVTPKYALLSTHAGRRTFICNALALGIPAQVVMKWTGHSDYKAMKPYIDIADDIKANAMNKFNQL